jgi:transcriptional regulator with XRE-family HTH domain
MDVALVSWTRRVAASGAARHLREAAGVHAAEIARQLNVSPAAISRWERGERSPRPQHAEAWGRLLRDLAQ